MLTYKGYAGQILRVNLTKKEITKQPLNAELARSYVGGSGFAAKILFDELRPGTDPFSPENKIVIATGPLTGTMWPSSGRCMFATKSPLTNVWAESHCGGFLGPETRYAGYDAIVLEGGASEPLYLGIEDEDVRLRDADHLWGKDTHEATKIIQDDLGDDQTVVASIGQAGENLVRYASIIVNLYRAAGRAGIGAVMGSKKLKAIAVRGSGGVEVADFEKFMALSQEAHRRVLENPQAQALAKYGTPLLVGYKSQIGELPTKNHYTGIFEKSERFSAETIRENYWARTRACFACSTMCKKVNTVDSGRYAGTMSEGPEYESIMAFGTNCFNADFGSILHSNLLCDKYGLDTISMGGVLSFLMECYEHGILKKKDADGIDLSWGNDEAIVTLINKTARREGVGDALAEGVMRLAQKIGKGSENLAMHVKGMEISGQDGRTHRSIGLSHATGARGADHLRSLVTIDQLGYEEVAGERFGKDKLPDICDPYSEKHKALAVKTTEDVYAIRDALIVCWYTVSWPPVFWIEDFAAVLPAVTGEEAFGSVDELMRIGERQVNLKRAFNVREGLGRESDRLPDRFTKEPMPDGPGRGQVVNLDTMLDQYYALRGWDPKTGVPTKRTLERLGLDDVTKTLEAAE